MPFYLGKMCKILVLKPGKCVTLVSNNIYDGEYEAKCIFKTGEMEERS